MTPPTFNIAVTEKDFKFPQLWWTNLAVDFKLPFDFVGSVEGIFNKNLNNVYYVNGNLEPSKTNYSGADDRPTYAGLGLSGSASNNALRINDKITDAIVLTNTKEGSTDSLTAKLERQFKKGFYTMLAYTSASPKDLMNRWLHRLLFLEGQPQLARQQPPAIGLLRLRPAPPHHRRPVLPLGLPRTCNDLLRLHAEQQPWPLHSPPSTAT